MTKGDLVKEIVNLRGFRSDKLRDDFASRLLELDQDSLELIKEFILVESIKKPKKK